MILQETSGSSLLMVQGVTVSFDGFKALNNLSFAIDKAELRAVIGPNGAGKTTFMDVITGKTRPDVGEIGFGVHDLRKLPEHKIAQLGIGRKFQRPTVFEAQSVRENLSMSLKKPRATWPTLLRRLNDADHDRIDEIARLIRLTDALDQPSGILSHGQKQWLEIGMLLAQEPKLLLVDEPAAGMTQAERDLTVQILREMAETRAVVVIEHDMEFVRNLHCKVTVLHEGSVLAEGSLDQVSNQESVIEVYLGR